MIVVMVMMVMVVMVTVRICEDEEDDDDYYDDDEEEEPLLWTCTGNMPRPRMSPERRHALCASLLSRNALQHTSTFRKSHFIRTFTGKKPRPRAAAHT